MSPVGFARWSAGILAFGLPASGRLAPARCSLPSLKSAAYAEPKDAFFLVKEERKTVDDLVATRVGIISINEAKRHVENRYLDAKLGAHAGAEVGKLRKQTLIKSHDGVGLRLATKEYLP